MYVHTPHVYLRSVKAREWALDALELVLQATVTDSHVGGVNAKPVL